MAEMLTTAASQSLHAEQAHFLLSPQFLAQKGNIRELAKVLQFYLKVIFY